VGICLFGHCPRCGKDVPCRELIKIKQVIDLRGRNNDRIRKNNGSEIHDLDAGNTGTSIQGRNPEQKKGFSTGSKSNRTPKRKEYYLMTTENGKISPRQKKTIEALITCRTAAEALQQAGISKTTYYRWMNNPDFVLHLREAEALGLDEATRYLDTGRYNALTTIEGLMTTSESDAIRLRAAQIYLDVSVKFRETASIETRISELERIVNNDK